MATTTASAGRVLLMNQGTWTTGTAYEVLDFVYYNGSTYVCKEDLTSTTAPNLDTNHWQVMAYGFDPTALEGLTAMITPDGTFSCTIGGVTYTNAQDAIDAVNALFAERPPIGDAWDADTSYTKGQYAIYNNVLYKALTTVPAGTLVTDTNYWASTTVTDELESHATDIATNTTNIATNASAISTLNSEIEILSSVNTSNAGIFNQNFGAGLARAVKIGKMVIVTITCMETTAAIGQSDIFAFIPDGFKPKSVVGNAMIASWDVTGSKQMTNMYANSAFNIGTDGYVRQSISPEMPINSAFFVMFVYECA